MLNLELPSCRPRFTRSRVWCVAALIPLLAMASRVRAQSNPVYLDDSPQARELLQQAADQRRDNIAESIRLYQELLDEYGTKLAPVSASARDHYVNVRSRVLGLILGDDELLERYRISATGEAERLLEGEQFELLAATRSLTESGLDALLRLSQTDVEAGRFRSALAQLAEARRHPDFTTRRAAHGWYLTGMAAHFLGDTALRGEALDALESLGAAGEQLHVSLGEASRRAPLANWRDDEVASATPMVDSLRDLVSEPIWTTPLSNSPLSRRYMDQLHDGNQALIEYFNVRRREGPLATVIPAVASDLVLVNEGHRITAFNRISGREQWHYLDRSNIAARETPDLERSRDPSFLGIADGRVVTLTGHARDSERTNRGRLICLDLETGALQWTVSMDRIGGIDDHDDLFPYGEPIISEGVVSILARKVTDQFLTSDYLIGVRLADGMFLWSQHIASTGGIRRSNERPFSTPVLHDGDVFISSPLGAVARVDAQHGRVRWLHRFDVPIILGSLVDDQEPWQICRPALTPMGLFALEPDLRRVAVLDVDSGSMISSLSTSSSDGWARPTYLLANEHSVYAIGHELRAFRQELLDTPAWVLDLSTAIRQSEPDGALRALQRPSIRGRVLLVDGALVVPTLEGALIVDDETGQILQRLSSQVAANPAVADAQIFTAGSTTFSSYMSFRRAEEILRDRLASSADAAEPALSLLRLGLRVRSLELVLESAELTLQAVNSRQLDEKTVTYRAELFGLLLEARENDLVQSRDDGDSLFSILSGVATGPEQRVQYLLAFADWLELHSIDQAVETYQTILSDPQLARTQLVNDERLRPASAWTTLRLQELLAEHGTQAYAPQADFARLRLGQIMARPDRDADALLALARDFPLAPASVEATIEASDILVAQGRVRDAVAALAETLRSGLNEPSSRRRLLSHIVMTCLNAGWTNQAADVLEIVISRYGDIELALGDGMVSASGWLEQLGGSPSARPFIGNVDGELIRDLPGRFVQNVRFESFPSQPLLFYDDGTLSYFDDLDAASRWNAPIGEAEPQLLDATAEQLLIWQEIGPGRSRITIVDRRTGEEVWSTAWPVDANRDDAAARARTINERMPNGDPFDPREVLPFATGDAVILVTRSGEVTSIDRRDGATVRWSVPEGLGQVHLAECVDGALVLAGMHHEPDARGGRGDLNPMVIAIDPATGEVVARIRPTGIGGIRWMTLDPFGRVVLAHGDQVEFIDAFTGRKLWSNIGYAAIESQRGWPTPHGVVIEDRLGQLHHIDDATGVMTQAFEENVRAELRARDLRRAIVVGDAIYARYQHRVIRYDRAGGVRGADVIVDDGHEYRWLLPGDDRLVLLSGSSTQSARRRRQGGSVVYQYRVSVLSDTCRLLSEYELPDLQRRIVHANLVDGWLLLSSETGTILVHMPSRD